MSAAATMITVAPTGAETAKADVPTLPASPEELVDTAVRCQAAGAAVIHVHVRDHREADRPPTLDPVLLREAVVAVRESTDLIVQLSTGGSVHDPLAKRLSVLDADPDSCSLTCGTTNFGDDVFMNPWGFMVDLYRLAQEREVVPEFELFDLGQVHSLRRLIDTCGLPYGGRVHVDFVLGVPGALPGTPQALLSGLSALPAEVTSWSATGVGRSHLPILATALACGGHARVGMEDNLVYAKGRPVAHNAELVTRAADLATLMQRPPMSVEDARDMLGIKDRRQH